MDADEALWSPVRSDYYLTPGVRLEELARRHGLPLEGGRARADREGWEWRLREPESGVGRA